MADQQCKVFYKMTMHPDEEGLRVFTKRFYSIHETPCFHYCVDESNYRRLRCYVMTTEPTLKDAKKFNIKTRRIDKIGSRIAFETEEKAFAHLLFLKRRQLRHLERDTEFLKAFLDKVKALDDLDAQRVVPDTMDLVRQYLIFE